jgi:predicted nucleotide-binding protein
MSNAASQSSKSRTSATTCQHGYAECRPAVFLGSSVEGRHIAKAIQVNLDHVCETTTWDQGVFGLSDATLDSLNKVMAISDFAILVLTPDDMVKARWKRSHMPRDNVLFELGLFMGCLGRSRTFAVYDRTADLKLPSDLAGITAATFQPHSSGNLTAALGAACTKIELAIRGLGCKRRFVKHGF